MIRQGDRENCTRRVARSIHVVVSAGKSGSLWLGVCRICFISRVLSAPPEVVQAPIVAGSRIGGRIRRNSTGCTPPAYPTIA